MKKLILVTLVLCMALSACTKAEVGKAPTAESAAASSVESTASGGKSAASEVSLPEKTKTAAHVTKTLSSGVEVDADVLIPASMRKSELPEMFGKGHIIDQGLVASVFFEGEKSPNKQTEESQDFSMFSKDSVYSTWTLEKERLTISGTSANFSNGRNEVGYYLFSEFPTSLPFGDNRVTYLSGENLEFSTIDEAKSQIQKYVNSLGISVLEPTCYTMDYDTMRDVYDGRTALETYDADFDFVMEPTKEDEQYVLEYPLAVNGMPFGSFDGGSYSGDAWATGTSVKVFYGAEGLNMLAMPYALDVTDAGTPQPVLTLDEAIQKLEEKFDSMIVEGEWRVDEIEMAYIAVPIEGTNDARLLPVWRFQTEHTMEYAGKDDPSQTTTLTDRGDILFNALDGTELFKNNGSI